MEVRRENERAGYGDANFISNSGSVYWFIVMYVIGFFLIGIALKISSKIGKNRVIKFFTGILFYNFLIGLLIEGYLELVFGSLI